MYVIGCYLYYRVFKDKKLPPVEDMVANLSLTLSNMHPTIGSSRALPPNIVPVGGLHLLEQPPPLPKVGTLLK